MKIELHEAGMRIAFRVNEDQTVELVDFSAAADAADLKPLGPSRARASMVPTQMKPLRSSSRAVTWLWGRPSRWSKCRNPTVWP